MNGFPYLTINKADLAAYEKGRPTAVIEEQLKTRFSDFKPAQVCYTLEMLHLDSQCCLLVRSSQTLASGISYFAKRLPPEDAMS